MKYLLISLPLVLFLLPIAVPQLDDRTNACEYGIEPVKVKFPWLPGQAEPAKRESRAEAKIIFGDGGHGVLETLCPASPSHL